MKSFNVMLIGGLPQPSGGVTVFMGRLVNAIGDKVNFSVLDINPGEKEPSLAKSIEITPQNKILRVLWTALKVFRFKGTVIHFNYSRPNSLYSLLLVPKFRKKFYVTLHNGSLMPSINKSKKFKLWLLKCCLSRADLVFSLCDDHLDFFHFFDYPDTRVCETKSHIAPKNFMPKYVDKAHEAGRKKYEKIIIASGYASPIYNYEYVVRFLNDNPNVMALFFLYGRHTDFEYLEDLKKCLNNKDQAIFYSDKSEEVFLSALHISDAFLRPNFVDSWGVSVADACAIGIPAVASDVCDRHPGAVLFKSGDYSDFTKAVNIALTPEKKSETKAVLEGMELDYLRAYEIHK